MKRAKKTPGEIRRAQLAMIHAEVHKMELDDDAYRDIVERVSGSHGEPVRSAGKCSPDQLAALVNEILRLRGAPARKASSLGEWAGRPAGKLPPLLAKIEALLADAGREWAYAIAMAKRMCKVDRLEWCSDDQLSKLVAALQIDANRRNGTRRRSRR
jgi:phage gp16-like protein